MLASRFAPLVLSAIGLLAQSGPATIGSGYGLPAPLYVSPGQLVTLYAQGLTAYLRDPIRAAGLPLPTSLAGFSVNVWQGTIHLAPILEVRPARTCGNPNAAGCTTLAAITVQIPFEIQPVCPACGLIDVPVVLNVVENGAGGAGMDVVPFGDQVHILTTCDTIMSSVSTKAFSATGLPCPGVVAHGDGSLVTARSPAQAGEELVAYAVGLGRTSPASMTGEAVTSPSPTQTEFTLDFNYRPNALPTKPATRNTSAAVDFQPASKPIFAGATPGFVGLYQINFTVPPVPPGTPACADVSKLPPANNAVHSNLTVSAGGGFSFDGTGICVAAK